MYLRMKIKKPAGKADFLAMIKGFDLFEFKNQTLFQKSECWCVFIIQFQML